MGNPVLHFAIGCRNKEKTVAFYEKAFGWTPEAGPFTTQMATGAGRGIDGAITALGHEPHNYVMIYIDVPDIEAACAAIRKGGGEITVGPTDIPGGGRFAWFTDPEGNLLAVSQSSPPA